MTVCVFVCMHVDVCELGTDTWMCGESWLAVPVLKAGHPGVPSYYMFVCLGYGWVSCFTFLFFLIFL